MESTLCYQNNTNVVVGNDGGITSQMDVTPLHPPEKSFYNDIDIDLVGDCFDGEGNRVCGFLEEVGMDIDLPVVIQSTPSLQATTVSGRAQRTVLTSTMQSSVSLSNLSKSYARRSIQSSPIYSLREIYWNAERRWGEVEDMLYVLLNGRLDSLEAFHNLHNEGVQDKSLLQSIAYLSTYQKERSVDGVYSDHVSTVAAYLSIGRARRERKLAVIRTLMTCLSPVEATWRCEPGVIDGILEFVTNRSTVQWDFMEYTETSRSLVCELRAISLHLQEQEQQRLARVSETADTAAMAISVGAMLVGEGMTRSSSAISNQIEHVAEHVKSHLKSNDYPLMMDRDAVIALTFADAAKRASIGAKEGTKIAMDSIRNASYRGLQIASNTLDECAISERLPPEGREALRAAGKVGLATVGAAVIVGEAMMDSSRAVMEKAALVTVDVVKHKYGASAGQVASDAGEAALNIMRTVGNFTTLSESTVLAKSVAKDTAKCQTQMNAENAKDTLKYIEAHAVSFLKSSIRNGDGGQRVGPIFLPSASSGTSKPLETFKGNVSTTTLHNRNSQTLFASESIPELITSTSTDSESNSSYILKNVTCAESNSTTTS